MRRLRLDHAKVIQGYHHLVLESQKRAHKKSNTLGYIRHPGSFGSAKLALQRAIRHPVLQNLTLGPLGTLITIDKPGSPTPQPYRHHRHTPSAEPMGVWKRPAVARKEGTSFSHSFIPIHLSTAISMVSYQASVVPVGSMPMVSHTSKLRDHGSVMLFRCFLSVSRFSWYSS